ncbi:uncharacterized protein G2W53_001332 [Senna tora]|uniref:Uncharacterized protein n=1 Tax=Senna tora TaxID=362788 RepID=A0A835CMG9_9FABA|nr:uncharacterized protein G2W53_001332 [Senna tora]
MGKAETGKQTNGKTKRATTNEK